MHLNFGAVNPKLPDVIPTDTRKHAVLLSYAKCDSVHYEPTGNYASKPIASDTQLNHKSVAEELAKIDVNQNPIDNSLDNKSSINGVQPTSKEVPDCRSFAVQVFGLTYSYPKPLQHRLIGTANTSNVLDRCTIGVPEASIYALLGSSGCGKTTLLKCILGRIRPKVGQVSVFGCQPYSPESTVPGRGVGYMTQELALFDAISIEDTLKYFGRIYGMTETEIETRIEFLVSLLHLPPKSKLISECSGGQQRRVSLSAALIHSPPLLILDEPTVGVDPMLRHEIWIYLQRLTSEDGVTVIITTHYIEEARNADTVGLMRGGRLLAEDNPETLICQYSAHNLEDVFLILCQHSDTGVRREVETNNRSEAVMSKTMVTDNKDNDLDKQLSVNSADKTYRNKYKKSKASDVGVTAKKMMSFARILALIMRNWIQIRGNKALFIMYFLPSLQLSFFYASVGKDPRNIHLAVTNLETPPQFTGNYLDSIDSELIIQDKYDSFEDAIDTVIAGKSQAALFLHTNFTRCAKMRIKYGPDASPESINCSNVRLVPDMANPMIGLTLLNSVIEAYEKFTKTYLTTRGLNPVAVSRPVQIAEVVYGSEKPNIQNFMAPGMIIALVFFAPFVLTSFVLIKEHKGGVLERSLVAGVTPAEVILSHLFIQMMVLTVQVAIMAWTSFYFWETPLVGSFWLAIAIIYLQGVNGIAYGLNVATLFPDEAAAFVVGAGLVFPTWVTCGVFWPIESMPAWMATLSKFLYLTLPIDSLRLILFRGWDLTSLAVILGFVSSVVYIFLLLSISVFLFYFYI